MESTRSNLLSKIRVAAVYEKNQQMILTFVATLIFVFFIFVFFIPSIKSIFEIIESNRQLDETLQTLESRQKSYEIITDYYNQVSKEEDSFLKLIPKDGEPFSTLGLINDLAIKSNIFLSSANLNIKDNGIEEYSIKFNGGYTQIMNFLVSIETAPRFFYVKNMDLRPESNTYFQSLSISVNLIAFYVH